MKRIAIIIMLLVATDALAQTTTVDAGGAVQWLQPYVRLLVEGIVGAGFAWGIYFLQKYTGIKIDKEQADVWQRAAKNQASSLIAAGAVKLNELGKIEVQSPELADAGNALLKSVPDAAKHFDRNINDAIAVIIAMVPQVPDTAVVNGTVVAAPPA